MLQLWSNDSISNARGITKTNTNEPFILCLLFWKFKRISYKFHQHTRTEVIKTTIMVDFLLQMGALLRSIVIIITKPSNKMGDTFMHAPEERQISDQKGLLLLRLRGSSTTTIFHAWLEHLVLWFVSVHPQIASTSKEGNLSFLW